MYLIDYMREAERLLSKYPDCNKEIQELNKELNQTLRLKLETQNTLKAQAMDGMPHSTNISDTTYKAVEQSIDRHDEHMKYLIEQINEQYRIKETVYEAIKRLTMEEYRVIELRYFKGYKVGRVAGVMHYNRSYCSEIISKGISKIAWHIETANKSQQKPTVF